MLFVTGGKTDSADAADIASTRVSSSITEDHSPARKEQECRHEVRPIVTHCGRFCE